MTSGIIESNTAQPNINNYSHKHIDTQAAHLSRDTPRSWFSEWEDVPGYYVKCSLEMIIIRTHSRIHNTCEGTGGHKESDALSLLL